MLANSEMLGILCVVAGANCSVVAHSFVRLLTGVPILYVMQARFGMQCCVMATLITVLRWNGQSLRLFGVPGQQHLLLLRAAAFLGALGFGWTAMQKLPIGVATGIVYSNPVLSGLLASCVIGKERLTLAFGVQAAVCLVGTALIIPTSGKEGSTQAESGEYLLGAIVAVISACLHAICPCAVRLMEGVHPLEVQLFQDAFGTLATIPLAAVAGIPPLDVEVWDHARFINLLFFTMAGLTASLLFIAGWRMAPVTKASLFTYTEIPTSFLVQIYFFHDIPATRQVIGACLIITATCVRLRMESCGTNYRADAQGRALEECKEAETEALLAEDRAANSQPMRRLQQSG
mmetsp:Transcript_39058/g.72747  ORF Transcript_39058/g.72747 Transcript_39058/m.72747 type:complete len:347 (+) Transcript_39058:98-1138(+)